jgi:hypothetical protein
VRESETPPGNQGTSAPLHVHTVAHMVCTKRQTLWPQRRTLWKNETFLVRERGKECGECAF